jgi:vacuolar-type H+-ATPase subunit I/STV1
MNAQESSGRTMLRTIIITFSIGMIVGFAGTLLSLFGGGSIGVEYVEFAVALLLFLVILIGAYWFMIGGSDTNERGRPGEKRRSPEKGKVP